MICSYFQDSAKRWRSQRDMFSPSVVVPNCHAAFEQCCEWLGTHKVATIENGNGSTIVLTIKDYKDYGKRKM